MWWLVAWVIVALLTAVPVGKAIKRGLDEQQDDWEGYL